MTPIIINHFTHNKTFSVYDKPNRAVKILEDSGYVLNPRVHAESFPPDGSLAGTYPSSAQGEPSTPFVINTEGKSGEPADIFGKDLVMDE